MRLIKVTQVNQVTEEQTIDLSNYYTKTEVNGLIPEVPATMDDITDGSTYVKTENNFTDAEKTKLGNLSESSGFTQAQILARNLGC